MKRVAGTTSAMLRINLPHIQIISWSWSLNLSWPASVLALRDTIGAFFSLDLMTATRPECAGGADGGTRAATSVLTSVALIASVFALLLILGAKYSCHRSKDTQLEQARKAHIVHYIYGLYSLSFPLLITQIAKWLDWSRLESGMWTNNEVPHVNNSHTWEMALAVGIAGFWLLLLSVVVPLKTVRNLRHKHEAGLLSDENPSLATQARLGWLYDKYTENTYYFEFVALVTRAVLILSGVLLIKNQPILGQLVCILVSLFSTVALMKLKPFEEDPEDAAKWSSTNKLATLAAACQAIDMGLGLAARVLEDNGMATELSSGLITISVVLVFMVPPTTSIVAEVQALLKLKQEKDKLGHTRDNIVEVTDSPL